MGKKRILLLHISNVSGHRSASMAIENALTRLNPDVEVKNIDGFCYVSPVMEKIINTLYMFVIKRVPQFWEHLYDNQDVLKKTASFRARTHKLKDKKVRAMFQEFSPDAIVCTQAFPCSLIADYKSRHNLKIPLIGVLTDYAPHSYWISEYVDSYIVPAEEIKQRFIQKGVDQSRIKAFGIPISVKFQQNHDRGAIAKELGLSLDKPVILIAGGGQGLGPIEKIVTALGNLNREVELIVACGTNQKLYKKLLRLTAKKILKNPVLVVGYTQRMDELMEISNLMVSKSGGLSSAEALSKALPMLIVHPLPGQESQNAQFLLKAGVALKAETVSELKEKIEILLKDKAQLENLRSRALALSRPQAAAETAELILKLTDKEYAIPAV